MMQPTLFDDIRDYNKDLGPILKWAGGKRRLARLILDKAPINFNKHRYIEPFFGGGAVLFMLQPMIAVVNDINNELINLYNVVRDDVDALLDKLKLHKQFHNTEYFYTIRNLDRNEESYGELSPIEKAARIIYLNKTCFNGLFRVNASGYFNVPIGGAKDPDVVNEHVLRSVSSYFNRADITFLNGDFEMALSGAVENDFVYMDPPYDALIDQSFVTYSSDGFSRQDQVRVKQACDKLSALGCKVMVSNSYTPFILDLYKDYKIEIIQAGRYISGKNDGRGKINEVLIFNY